MLVAALAMTGVGLLFLMIALHSGLLIWAWLCIAVCGVGFVLLLIDVVKERSGECAVQDHPKHESSHTGLGATHEEPEVPADVGRESSEGDQR